MRFDVTILGSSSATPIFNRNPTSQLININEKYFLVDCGEGTQQQLLRFGIKAQRISNIFISHLHGDHYLGLVGLLSSLHLNGRTKAVSIYAPAALEEILEVQFRHSQTTLRYPINFTATSPDGIQKLFENPDVVVSSFPLDHRIPCTGFLFAAKRKLPKINREIADKLKVPYDQLQAIKKGASYTDASGKVHSSISLTLPPDAPKSYAYCSDTINSGTYLDAIRSVDLLYHEATFMHDMLERAKETFHTTTIEAAEVARSVEAKRLLIGHFSARYRELQPLLDETKSVFPESYLAIEGEIFEV